MKKGLAWLVGKEGLVGKKGLNSMIRSSLDKGEEELCRTLKSFVNSKEKIYVHHSCRLDLNDFRQKNDKPEPKRLCSSVEVVFCWKTCCFLCSKRVLKRSPLKFHQVQILPIHDTIVKRAKERADEWGEAVLTRFGNSKDLVTQGAVYHSTCMADFKLNNPNDANSDVSRGRPPNKSYFDAFKSFCVWLEDYGKSEVYSVRELHEKMLNDNDGVGYCLKSF